MVSGVLLNQQKNPYNFVNCKDYRYNIFNTNFFEFLKIEWEPFNESDGKFLNSDYVSYDGGLSFK